MPTENDKPQADQESDNEPAADVTLGKDGKPFDPARAQATIEALRKTEKEYEKLKKADEARQRQELTETDRLKAEKKDLEKQMAEVQSKANDRLARASVIEAAAQLGFADPADAWTILRESLSIKDGEIEDLDKALAALAKRKPYLLKGQSDSSTPPGETKPPARPPSPGNPGGSSRLTADDLKKMSPAEVAKRWDDPKFRQEASEAAKGS